MIGTLAIVFAVRATVVLSGAARYPSGLNPALCPNYPHCDNALLAAYAQPAANDYGDNGRQYNGDNGQYNGDNGQYNGDYGQYHGASGHYGSGHQNHPSTATASLYNHHHRPSVASPYTEPGYPAGLTSSNCPNYPYCSHQVPADVPRYSQPKRYPSGVTPQSCPNYPYCH